MIIKDSQNISADIAEFFFNLSTILADEFDVGFVVLALLFLFNRGDDSPGSTTRTNNVFVGNGEEVSFFNCQFDVQLGNSLHRGNHLFISFSLFAKLGKEDTIFAGSHVVLC